MYNAFKCLLMHYLEYWGTLHSFSCFVHKMYLFANYCLVSLFFFLTDKNFWFSSQRRREGVIMFANGSISKHYEYCVLCVCPLSKVAGLFAKMCQLLVK